MNQTLMQDWWVTKIGGEAISESLSQLQSLVAEHVSEDINVSFYDSSTDSNVQFNADGTWILEVSYYFLCERQPELDQNADFISSERENSSLVSIYLSVGGNYVVGYDTEKQSNVLIFETEKATQVTIYHENPHNEVIICPADLVGCPPTKYYPAFTADLDWSIFEEEPLSKLFSTPLFDTQTDTPVVYTWDMVTAEGTAEDNSMEQDWSGGSSTLPEASQLIRRTIRLYSHGQEDISLRRTDEKTD